MGPAFAMQQLQPLEELVRGRNSKAKPERHKLSGAICALKRAAYRCSECCVALVLLVSLSVRALFVFARRALKTCVLQGFSL